MQITSENVCFLLMSIYQ